MAHVNCDKPACERWALASLRSFSKYSATTLNQRQLVSAIVGVIALKPRDERITAMVHKILALPFIDLAMTHSEPYRGLRKSGWALAIITNGNREQIAASQEDGSRLIRHDLTKISTADSQQLVRIGKPLPYFTGRWHM